MVSFPRNSYNSIQLLLLLVLDSKIMTSITNAKLGWNESGTPVSDKFDDVYFSNINGLEETRYVFLKNNQLPERWQTFPHRRFIIGETGFGTGLNFLAVWHCFEQFRQQNPNAPLKELHFISFEKYPLSLDDLVLAHQTWPELKTFAKQLHQYYPIATPECHRIMFADGQITLDLWFGDVKDCMPMVPTPKDGLIDAWFLDGFAPSKNPDMWSQALFNNMANLAKHHATCATFTAAGFVRRGLIDAGFEMKKVKGFGTKREMIAGKFHRAQPFSNIKPEFHCQGVPNIQDVAIIGGGIASASLAYALTQRGIPVTLYCKDAKPAQGASSNRQGALYPLLNAQHDALSRFFASSAVFAHQFYVQLAEKISFDHQWCGVTQLLWDEKSIKKLGKLRDGHFPPELVTALSPEQTNEKVGLPIDMASVYYSRGGWLSPVEVTQQLLKWLADNRTFTAHYHTNVAHLNWDKKEENWTLITNEKTYQHQCVVIANGHEFKQFPQTSHLPLTPVKGQVSHVPTNEHIQPLKTVLCQDGYFTPVSKQDQLHCVGASHDRNVTDTEFSPDVQVENAARIQRCIPNQTWPQYIDISDNLSRQGVRCVSRDHLPFVGNLSDLETVKAQYKTLSSQPQEEVEELTHYPNLYTMLGLGARGVCSAPLLGEYLASLLCQDPLPLACDVMENLHPSRMWIRKLAKGKFQF